MEFDGRRSSCRSTTCGPRAISCPSPVGRGCAALPRGRVVERSFVPKIILFQLYCSMRFFLILLAGAAGAAATKLPAPSDAQLKMMDMGLAQFMVRTSQLCFSPY